MVLLAVMLRKVEKAMQCITLATDADKWLKLNQRNLRLFQKMLINKIENPLRLEANIAPAKSYQRHHITPSIVQNGTSIIEDRLAKL